MKIDVLQDKRRVLLTVDNGQSLEVSFPEFWEICRFGDRLDVEQEVREYLSQGITFNGIDAENIENDAVLMNRIVETVIERRIGEENGNQIYDVICDCLSNYIVKPHYAEWKEYVLSQEKCNDYVDDIVANIRGFGVTAGSGYYGLKAFELYGEPFTLYCEIVRYKDGDKEYYGVYYAVEFDEGDNVFSDWKYTETLDVDELKKVVFELANRDYSDTIQRTIELSDIGLEVDTLKCLSDMRFKTLADVVSVGKVGLECVFPQVDSARMCQEVISKFGELGIELPEGYEHTQEIIDAIDAKRLKPSACVTVSIDTRELGETVWVNPAHTGEVGFRDECVCVDVIFDGESELCDVENVFEELDYWCTSRINAVTLANAISQEYSLPINNCLKEENSLEKVLAEASERSAVNNTGKDKDLDFIKE